MADGPKHRNADRLARLTEELRGKIIVLEAQLTLQDADDPAGTAAIRAELEKVRELMAQLPRIT